MEEQKCFCHFNGYEVKDAYARRQIAEKTAELNTSIENVSNQVNNVSNQVNNVNNRNFIFFGDSYGSGEIGHSWLTNVVDNCGLTAGENVINKGYFNYCKSGASFLRSDNLFNNHLTDCINYLTEINYDKNLITDIFMVGGLNDAARIGSSELSLTTQVSLFISTCKTNFPNAKIHFGFIGWTPDKTEIPLQNFISCIDVYRNVGLYGACYIENIEYSLHKYDLFQDTIHPNVWGNRNIGSYLSSYIINGCCSVLMSTVNTTYTLNTNVTKWPDNIKLKTLTNNANSLLYLQSDNKPISFTFTEVVTLSSTPTKLFDIDSNSCFIGDNICVPISCIAVTQDNQLYSGGFSLLINNKEVSIISLQNLTNIKYIQMYDFRVESDSLHC